MFSVTILLNNPLCLTRVAPEKNPKKLTSAWKQFCRRIIFEIVHDNVMALSNTCKSILKIWCHWVTPNELTVSIFCLSALCCSSFSMTPWFPISRVRNEDCCTHHNVINHAICRLIKSFLLSLYLQWLQQLWSQWTQLMTFPPALNIISTVLQDSCTLAIFPQLIRI